MAIAEAEASKAIFAVILLDIDRFREINNAFGHAFGDELLRLAAARLRADADPRDDLARLGADEFALLVRSDPFDALRIADGMRHALEIPFEIEGQGAVLTGSAGIAFFPEHGANETTLLRHAEIAMEAAKRTTGTTTIFASAIDGRGGTRVALAPELRRAITDGLLTVHYQPIVPLRADRSFTVEALARWPHPQRGMIAPAEFVPLAENTGLIKGLTELVLRQATAEVDRWRVAERGVSVAVNVSMRNLRDPSFVNEVRARIARHRIDPGRLCLEITEGVVMADPDHTLVVLRHLRDLGVRIAIDDFGTGYSSLAYLRRLPLDILKIDRTFVVDLADAAGPGAAIVRAMIELGHALGLAVVGEGVETEEQLAILRDLGCDQAQGFAIGPPMRAADLAHWLRAEPPRFSAP